MPEQTPREQIQPILKTLKLAAVIDQGSVGLNQEGCNSLADLLEMLVGNYESLKKEYGRVFAECTIRGLKLSGAENEVAKLNSALATAVARARREALEEAAKVASADAGELRCASSVATAERIMFAIRDHALAATPPEARQTETGWHSKDTPPDVGRKFIALWDDGSGAAILFRHDHGFIDSDRDDYTTLNASLDRWAYLPDDFEFRCELVSEPGEHPMRLSASPPPAIGNLEGEGRSHEA